jgi:hypothetical protein
MVRLDDNSGLEMDRYIISATVFFPQSWRSKVHAAVLGVFDPKNVGTGKNNEGHWIRISYPQDQEAGMREKISAIFAEVEEFFGEKSQFPLLGDRFRPLLASFDHVPDDEPGK